MTNHRTEAQKLLEDILEQGDPYEPYTRTEMALMAIGHALLASLEPQTLEVRDIVTPDMRCGTTDDEGRRCTRGALHIMGAAGHHFEDNDPEQP